MKSFNRIVSMFFVSVAFFTQSPMAFAMKGGVEEAAQDGRETLKWVGTIKDDTDSHTTEHKHELKFVRKDNGDFYDIVDSPELVKLHHETEKNFVLEIEAEKTARFLFWGGNLIVKRFKVIEEASARIPHTAALVRSERFERRFSSRHEF